MVITVFNVSVISQGDKDRVIILDFELYRARCQYVSVLFQELVRFVRKNSYYQSRLTTLVQVLCLFCLLIKFSKNAY